MTASPQAHAPKQVSPFATTYVPRLLFADDAAAARVLMSALLRRMNLSVEVAGDGEQVIEMVQRSKFDLILLDIDMPVMDGMATARIIRQIEGEGVRTPIIAVSGFLAQTVNRGSEPSDFDGTVPKPVTLARLWSVMGRFLPDGHACAERSSVLRVAAAKMPLFATSGRGKSQTGSDFELTAEDMAAALQELRHNTLALECTLSGNQARDDAMAAAVRLDELATRIGAPRLQRRASVLAALAQQGRAEELRGRTRDLISCALATIGQLKKRIASPA